MRPTITVLLLTSLSIAALSQTSAVGKLPTGQVPGQKPALDAPVLKVPHAYVAGYCKAPVAKSKASDDCVVTRAMLEDMLNALPKPDKTKAAELSPEFMRGFANAYASTVAWVHEAHLRGIDQSSRFRLQIQWVQGQILQHALKESLQEQSSHPSEAAIARYYKDNQRRFEQIKLERLYVPALGDADPTNPAAERPKATLEDAQRYRTRAVAGEPLAKLQDEIWKAMMERASPPPQDVTRRRGAMRPENEAAIFDLAPNALSEVIQEGGGFTFYRLLEKKVTSLDEAREDIRRTLAEQAVKDAEADFAQKLKPEFDPSYFREAKSAAETPQNSHAPVTPASKPDATPAK